MKKGFFEKGEYVVCPAHGVGIVNGFEKKNISGTDLEFVVIYFSKDKMTLKLPLNCSTIGKIRKLCSEKEMQEAIACINSPVRVKKAMWSRRAQEYEAKINSGIPMSIAQVIRDLRRTASHPERSYSERQIYQEALERLIKEYAAVAKIDEKEASANIEKVLTAA